LRRYRLAFPDLTQRPLVEELLGVAVAVQWPVDIGPAFVVGISLFAVAVGGSGTGVEKAHVALGAPGPQCLRIMDVVGDQFVEVAFGGRADGPHVDDGFDIARIFQPR